MPELDIKTLIEYVNESRDALRECKSDAWRDSRAVDGAILSERELEEMRDSGVEPQMINRIFPVVNLLIGSQHINQHDITAKGRTTEDAETGQTMTESIQFVMDQNGGNWLISEVFESTIKTGMGFIHIGEQADPRREKILLEVWPWQECYWDPFDGPWLDRNQCRYFFRQRWMDIDQLVAMVPEKEREIRQEFASLSDAGLGRADPFREDEADEIEESRIRSGEWVQGKNRCKPVEMYYTTRERAVFAILPGDRVMELRDDMDPHQQYSLYHEAIDIEVAVVPKMRVCQFLGRYKIYDGPSPFGHDLFPVAPFIGYRDSYRLPYGVVRQILPQAKEVIKRRSMALELMRSRRTVIEEGAVDSPADLDAIHEEANKIDGQLVLKNGAISGNRFRIEEQVTLAGPHMDMLRQSEQEIQQISGANDELMGYHGRTQSGIAIERKQQQGATITASLFGNYRRSLQRLGELIYLGIQKNWSGHKVLRITDRLSGAERFVELNKKTVDEEGNDVVKNDITQGRYDIIISQTPAADTIREKNLELISEWIKKSPPDAIPVLYELGLELSGLPNKEKLLAKIRPLLGVAPGEEDLSPEEVKQIQIDQAEAMKTKQAEEQEFQKAVAMEELRARELGNDKLEVEIAKARQDMDLKERKDNRDADRDGIEAFQKGIEAEEKLQGDANAQGRVRTVPGETGKTLSQPA